MKPIHSLYIFALVAVFLFTACGGPAPAEPAPVVEQPQVVEPAAPAPAEPEPTAVPPQPEPTQPQYAPFCEAAPAGCEAPTVTQKENAFCVDKRPYAIMSAPAGSTYESVDGKLVCKDQMNADGDMRITCHDVKFGELYSYDLKVCNAACTAPALQMDTGQCPEGYGYDAAAQCCVAPSPTSDDGCVVFQVDIGTCPEKNQ